MGWKAYMAMRNAYVVPRAKINVSFLQGKPSVISFCVSFALRSRWLTG